VRARPFHFAEIDDVVVDALGGAGEADVKVDDDALVCGRRAQRFEGFRAA
jgi:hypothetical protein